MSNNFVLKCNCSIWFFLLNLLIAFHYRSYRIGLFFYTKIGSIIPIGDLPTKNISEPFYLSKHQKRKDEIRPF